jgi:hypothetical protein
MTRNKLAALILALLLLTCFVGFQSTGKAWEYKITTLQIVGDTTDATLLSADGRQGWELVAVEERGRVRTYFLKRQK